MAQLAIDYNNNPIQAAYPGAAQSVAIGAASAQSTAVGSSTRCVRLRATADCYVKIGGNPTANTTTSTLLGAGETEYFRVNPGDKVAVIQASAAGTLNVTELA